VDGAWSVLCACAATAAAAADKFGRHVHRWLRVRLHVRRASGPVNVPDGMDDRMMCTCSTNGTCLPTRLPPPPPPRIEFVSRATRAGTTNPRTGLWAVDASVPVWPYTPGRSHTRKSRQARAMAFVLSGRRGLITRWKRHAIAKNNRRNPVRPTATPTTRADVVVVVVIKTEYRFENVFLNANNALHDYYYFILLIIGFGNNNHNNNNNRSSTGFTPPPFAYFCAIRNSLFE